MFTCGSTSLTHRIRKRTMSIGNELQTLGNFGLAFFSSRYRISIRRNNFSHYKTEIDKNSVSINCFFHHTTINGRAKHKEIPINRDKVFITIYRSFFVQRNYLWFRFYRFLSTNSFVPFPITISFSTILRRNRLNFHLRQ